MTYPEKLETPHRAWYVAHIWMWFISGIICYLVWRHRNPKAAKWHLLHSLWIGLVPTVVIFLWVIPLIEILSGEPPI